MISYTSHTKVMSSWILGLLPYHEKLCELLSNVLGSLHLYTSSDVSAAHNHLF